MEMGWGYGTDVRTDGNFPPCSKGRRPLRVHCPRRPLKPDRPTPFVRTKKAPLDLSLFSQVFILVAVFVESLVVISRGVNHFRITRALRPVFLIDCRYARGVRRFVRQILFSLPPVLEMTVLLLFFNFIFAILGNSLFSSTDVYFGTFSQSIVSLFVLLS